jgi:hypothetical protein
MSNPGTLIGSGIIRLGSGDLIGARVGGPPAAHHMDVRDGSAALPVAIGVSASYSRVDSTTRAELDAMGPVGTDGPDGATVLRAAIKGTPTSQVQVVGLLASAWQTGAYAGTGADACPLYGAGRTSGEASGTAFGAYLEAHRETVHRAIPLELRIRTNGGIEEDNEYIPNGPSITMAAWINAQNEGGKKSAAAIQIGHAFASAFDVGLAANEGSISSAFLRDDSASKVSLDIWGTHATAAIRVKNGAGPIMIGTQSLSGGTTTQLLEINSQETNRNPVIKLAAGANISHTILFNNTSANATIGQSGGVGALIIGTVGGDLIVTTGNKSVHIGQGVGRAMVRVSNNLALGTSAADSFAGGKGIVFIANAETPPSETPANGGIFFVEAGALKYKGSAGTVTTIAPA